jgi:Na+-transporting methylmalonyl-CoA/oxaloacetate decarboxylase gamma subunit
MKPAVIIGVVLIVLSILSFAYQGITFTTREKVLDIGPIEATAESKKQFRCLLSSARWR